MPSGPSPEWRKEFADRREKFIESLRAAVASLEVISRVFDGEDGYSKFSKWENGKLVTFDQGTLADAEAFLRHLIDQGHVVAYAVNRSGDKAAVCVSYDADQKDWSAMWPEDFPVDATKTSQPMTREWRENG